MKAVVLESPGQAEVRNVREPESPGPDEVLLRVRKIGLCGSDLNSYRGRNPLVSYPRIMGHEVAATVVACGAEVQGWPAETPVTLSPYSNCGKCTSCLKGRPNACEFNQTLGVQRDGALKDFLMAPASRLFRADLSLKELCLVEPLTVGFHAAARGRVAAGEIVAVFGCGGVGLGAVAGAAFRGATVVAVDLDDAKLNTAQKAGATHAINTAEGDLHDQLVELTGGRGPDVVIEAIGLPQTFRGAVEEVAFTGRVVYIGYAKEHVAYETRMFVQKELDILGSRNAQPEDFRDVIRMLEAKRFPVDDAVTHMVPIDEAPAILEAWSAEPVLFGKIMVDVG
ncbi:MAG TPA: zinc-binding alcohol dehydrogenase family protein [Terracidiphilus sp.]|nr:zinc-binding alcohol dehydrogenase family protein [Terracidiphilus sp.]